MPADRPLAPIHGYPSGDSPARAPDPQDALIEEMIQYRQAICMEHAINADHHHCIGCKLVMDHMQQNHPAVKYGTADQWVLEAAYCSLHERDIVKEFLRRKGVDFVQTKPPVETD